MGMVIATRRPLKAMGDLVDRKTAMLQLRIVRTVVDRERALGTLTPALRRRAVDIVERTAIEIEPDVNGEWARLLAETRAELRQD